VAGQRARRPMACAVGASARRSRWVRPLHDHRWPARIAADSRSSITVQLGTDADQRGGDVPFEPKRLEPRRRLARAAGEGVSGRPSPGSPYHPPGGDGFGGRPTLSQHRAIEGGCPPLALLDLFVLSRSWSEAMVLHTSRNRNGLYGWLWGNEYDIDFGLERSATSPLRIVLVKRPLNRPEQGSSGAG
jgi:hypothetical protein